MKKEAGIYLNERNSCIKIVLLIALMVAALVLILFNYKKISVNWVVEYWFVVVFLGEMFLYILVHTVVEMLKFTRRFCEKDILKFNKIDQIADLVFCVSFDIPMIGGVNICNKS